jgi:hypothetical protein
MVNGPDFINFDGSGCFEKQQYLCHIHFVYSIVKLLKMYLEKKYHHFPIN